ncbi:MAG: hypothetical protein IPI81_17885 [Flavobacteriales bacterium]|nr:hypothetical protein [Flavobacteriales bacterium]
MPPAPWRRNSGVSAYYNASNVREAGDEHWIGRGGYQFGIDALLGNNRLFVKPGMHFLVRNLRYTYSNGTDVVAQTAHTPAVRPACRSAGCAIGTDPATESEGEPLCNGEPTALIS